MFESKEIDDVMTKLGTSCRGILDAIEDTSMPREIKVMMVLVQVAQVGMNIQRFVKLAEKDVMKPKAI